MRKLSPSPVIQVPTENDQPQLIGRTQQRASVNRTTENSLLRPTIESYQDLEELFDFINLRLIEVVFKIKLRQVMITMPKCPRYMGYFHAHSWQSNSTQKETASEIALNPLFFTSDKEIFQTMAHEMIHHGQHEYPDIFGKPCKRGYHGNSFAVAMEKIGLQVSSTGKPDGKKSGVCMSEYVIEGCVFEQIIERYESTGLSIRWSSIVRGNNSTTDTGNELTTHEEIERMRKRRSKTKYSCPSCKLIARAKPNVKLGCLQCSTVMQEIIE